MIKRDRTYATVRDIWNVSQDVLNKEQIEEIYVDLKQLTNVDAALKAAHIENIEKKYKKEKKNETNDESIDKEMDIVSNNTELICPRCGSELVLRTAKKGDNVGNQFYGCSAFPRCRFIKNE